jgi:opacity protein-like surface antigen
MRTALVLVSRALALGALLALPAAAGAQGSVGTQGYGYPTGQLSTRARGTAGAVAPFDALSPLNPAALIGTADAVLHAQYEPEFRSVEIGDVTERSTLSRFPLVIGALPIGRRSALSLSAATYLDRTFTSVTTGPRTVADTTIEARQSRRSVGSITDVRIGAARALSSRLSVGVGVHGYSGENRVSVSFADDSARFIVFDDSIRLNYSGMAASAGVSWRPAQHLALAGSYKRGGTLTVRDDNTDEELGAGRVPDHVTAGVLYDGLAGTTLAASLGWQGWSALNELGSVRAPARDAREFALGADAAGPRFGRGVISLRAGAAWRELPFAVTGQGDATELAFSFGAGVPLAYNRATVDLGAQRARRTAGDARETGWLLSVGLSVRP